MLGHPSSHRIRRRLALRRFLSRFRFFILVLIVAIMAGTAAGGWWAYGKFKSRQSRHLATLATDYLRESKLPEAKMSLDTALRLNPSNPDARRLLARIETAQGGGASSLQNWQKLAESGSLTLEDLSNYAVAAAREGEWSLAERLADAAARGGNPVLRHLLRSELLGSKNDLPGAEAELRLAVEADKTGNAKASLAKFLIARRLTAETAPEVLELLRSLSARPDALGADALATAISNGLVPQNEIPGWISSLRAHPQKNSQQLLMADLVEVRLQPQEKSAVAKRTAARLANAPLPDRAAALQWFFMLGELELASSIVKPEEALQSREILANWLDTQAVQKRWDVVLQTLGQPDLPLPSHLQKLYRGRALIESGRADQGRSEYQAAYEETLGDNDKFFETLAYLASAQQTDLFEQGLKLALANPDTAESALRVLIPAVQRQRDAAKLRRIYELALATSPTSENLTVRNDFDYLSLLIGQPVDAREIALRSQANPRDFAFRVTNALALLRADQGKRALTELDHCEPDVYVPALAPHQKAVVAAALAASGRREEALQVASMVPPQVLSVQEVDLLRTYLAPPSPPNPTPKKPALKKNG